MAIADVTRNAEIATRINPIWGDPAADAALRIRIVQCGEERARGSGAIGALPSTRRGIR